MNSMGDNVSNVTSLYELSRQDLKAQQLGFLLWIVCGTPGALTNVLSLVIFSRQDTVFKNSSRLCIINLCMADLIFCLNQIIMGVKQNVLLLTNRDDVITLGACWAWNYVGQSAS